MSDPVLEFVPIVLPPIIIPEYELITFEPYDFEIVVVALPLPDGIVNGTSGVDYIDGTYVDANGDFLTTGDNIVLLGSSSDTFVGGVGNADVTGGGGRDTLYGVSGYNILNGNGGNDTLHSGINSSVLFGGNGDDDLFIDVSHGADHTVTGGDGADTFAIEGYADNRASVTRITDFDIELDTLTLDGLNAVGSAVEADRAFIIGGDFYAVLDNDLVIVEGFGPPEHTDSHLAGTSGADSFTLANGTTNGEDIVFLGAGDDFVRLGKGADIAFGGAGDDVMMGQKGNNMLYGEDGNDTLDSGQHASVLNGGMGDDLLSANMRNNGEHILSGGQGADTFTFYSGRSTTRGTAVVQDFEVGTDSLVLNGSFGIDSASYEATDDGLLVSFDNGSDVMFVGLGYEDASALGFDDIFIVG